MSMVAFDTLAFSKRLQEAGVPSVQADAQAQAQADFLTHHLLAEVATKDDLKRLQDAFERLEDDFKRLQNEFEQVKNDFKELKNDFKELRNEFKELQNDFKQIQGEVRLLVTKEELKRFATKDDLKLMSKILTIRLGAIMAVAVGVLAAILRL